MDRSEDMVGREEGRNGKESVKEMALAIAPHERVNMPALATKPVEAPSNTRRGRAQAEQEQEAQWRIKQDARRAILAQEAAAVVTRYGVMAIDHTVEAALDNLYRKKRHKYGNSIVAMKTASMLQTFAAGVEAIQETAIRRVGEEV